MRGAAFGMISVLIWWELEPAVGSNVGMLRRIESLLLRGCIGYKEAMEGAGPYIILFRFSSNNDI